MLRLLAPLAMLVLPLTAQETRAFVGARLIPIETPPIENGVLVVSGGRITAIGGPDTPIPADAERIDVAGKVLLPGLVCSHSHVGSVAGADQSAPIQPEVRALDAINVRDPGIQKAQAGGITTINCMPGSGHLLSGQTVYLKLRDGRTIDDLLIRNADGSPAGGIKMANGTNSMRGGKFPGTRARSAALVRAAFVRAQEYRNKLSSAAADPAKQPARDLGLEALVDVLEGRRVVHFHTHRHDDILTVLRLREEFGFRTVLHHVSDGWKVATEIARAGVPCSIIVVDSPGGKLEARDVDFRTGGELARAGVLVGFHTDDPITDSRLFLRSAALAVRAGMARDEALAALTLHNARILDLHDRIGSLRVGKDADFVLLDGDPLSVWTKVLQTWVDGKKVFDRADPADHLLAVGGPGASEDQAFTMCCYGSGEAR